MIKELSAKQAGEVLDLEEQSVFVWRMDEAKEFSASAYLLPDGSIYGADGELIRKG